MTAASKPEKPPKLTIGQWFEKNGFPGMTPKTFRHHYSLWPVHGCIVVGVVWCMIFSTRTFLFNPDSTFLRRDNYERYRDGTYFKLFNIAGVVLPCTAPVYRKEGDPDDESYALPEY